MKLREHLSYLGVLTGTYEKVPLNDTHLYPLSHPCGLALTLCPQGPLPHRSPLAALLRETERKRERGEGTGLSNCNLYRQIIWYVGYKKKCWQCFIEPKSYSPIFTTFFYIAHAHADKYRNGSRHERCGWTSILIHALNICHHKETHYSCVLGRS